MDAPLEHPTRLADGRLVSTDELLPIVYEDLRRLAGHFFQREPSGMTIQPTALAHEAWLRLADQENQKWQSRAHFLAVAAHAMRRVLASAARSRARLKRGGAAERVTLSGCEPESDETTYDLLDLEASLQALARVKERYARIVELRYFAGLSIGEVAEVLGVSRTIIDREWSKSRAWLATYLEENAQE